MGTDIAPLAAKGCPRLVEFDRDVRGKSAIALRTAARPPRVASWTPLATKSFPETIGPNGSHHAPVKRIIRNSLTARY